MKKKAKETPNNRFDIDFFEFSLLVEACIPPRPIARAYFWQQVIDKYYHVLTSNERAKLFAWVNRNPSMEDGIENQNEDCLMFNAIFNPDNQYRARVVFEGKESEVDCFKWKDCYYTSTRSHINEQYIEDVVKYNSPIINE